MQKSSKFRLFLAGLTAAALIGGVMAADPADAGKKKKKRAKAKSSKVVQVSKGGKAKAGNGGNGGKGGNSGNVHNTGNVGGGGGLITVPMTPDETACAVAALVTDDPQNRGNVISALRPQCFDNAAVIPEDFIDCVIADPGTLTEADIEACLGEVPTVQIPGPVSNGSVFSGSGGSGASGGTGGNAVGGTGGNNMNSSSTTVNSDDHSINAG